MLKDTIRYEFLTKSHACLDQAIECLTHTFVGIDIAGKYIQEPMVACLGMSYEEFHNFTENYMLSVVDQGYCAVAIDKDVVVAVQAFDLDVIVSNVDTSKDSLSSMDIIMTVLDELNKRFMGDYKKQYGETIHDGEVLNLTMFGTKAEHGRHEIFDHLVNMALNKAASQGVKVALALSTNPKSARLLERHCGMYKYKDIEGNNIVHIYKDNKYLNSIPSSVAEGTYVIFRQLNDYDSNDGNHCM